jgi:hypothetical protein
MKKFTLYFLLLLLIVGIGALVFGFWNARNIRNFSSRAQGLVKKYSFELQIGEIEKNIRGSSAKKASEMNQEARNFVVQLEGLIEQSQSAARETKALSAPKDARPTKDLILAYYEKSGKQATELKGFVEFMRDNFEVADVFSQINQNTTLDEMKALINQAKEKVGVIETSTLPESLQPSASELKQSMENFLLKLEETATLLSLDTDELNKAYSSFSEKQSNFSAEGKKYLGSLEDLAPMKGQINSELLKLSGIYFRIE